MDPSAKAKQLATRRAQREREKHEDDPCEYCGADRRDGCECEDILTGRED